VQVTQAHPGGTLEAVAVAVEEEDSGGTLEAVAAAAEEEDSREQTSQTEILAMFNWNMPMPF